MPRKPEQYSQNSDCCGQDNLEDNLISGMGKTFLCYPMCYDWPCGTSNNTIFCSMGTRALSLLGKQPCFKFHLLSFHRSIQDYKIHMDMEIVIFQNQEVKLTQKCTAIIWSNTVFEVSSQYKLFSTIKSVKNIGISKNCMILL